jgi:hypothetical protein
MGSLFLCILSLPKVPFRFASIADRVSIDILLLVLRLLLLFAVFDSNIHIDILTEKNKPIPTETGRVLGVVLRAHKMPNPRLRLSRSKTIEISRLL